MKKTFSLFMSFIMLFIMIIPASAMTDSAEEAISPVQGTLSAENTLSSQNNYSTASNPAENSNLTADSDPSPKEEVVYGILNLDGSVKNLYVVNIFEGNTITDYGNYTEIRNLTTSEKIDADGDKITVSTVADKFYYQGTLEEKDLPWDIAIKYFLDGEEIQGEKLAGKSGRLKIAVSVNQNKNVNSYFFNNYALQISISLDNKLCSNIVADNATIAEAAGKKQLTYTCLPGNGIDFTVTADVRNFEMEPITINGIRLSMDIPVDSNIFSNEIAELTKAIETLDDGAGELLLGLGQFSGGMQKYIDGLKSYKDGLGQLTDGAGKLDEGVSALKNGLSMLTGQNDFILAGALAIQQATFDSINATLSGLGLALPVLTPDNYAEVLSQIPFLSSVKAQLDGVIQFTQGLASYMDGVAQLEKGASDLAKGTAEFKSSSSIIAYSADELYKAGAELNEAAKQLLNGMESYKDGTNKLREGTSGMSLEMNNKINELIGSISGKDEKTVSFVSEKNTKVTAVQFILKTDSIDLPEEQNTSTEEVLEPTYWQRLLKLFGLYK